MAQKLPAELPILRIGLRTSERRSICDSSRDGIGVSAGCYVFPRRDLAIHREGLDSSSAGFSQGIGADGVAPVGGAPRVAQHQFLRVLCDSLLSRPTK